MLKTNTSSLHSFLEWLFVTNNDNRTVQVSSHSRHSGKMSAQADQLAEAKKKKAIAWATNWEGLLPRSPERSLDRHPWPASREHRPLPTLSSRTAGRAGL